MLPEEVSPMAFRPTLRSSEASKWQATGGVIRLSPVYLTQTSSSDNLER
jgi:hypothetical protein